MRLRALLVAVTLSLVALPAAAQLSHKITKEEMTADATRIVVGVVTAHNVIDLTTDEGDTGIFTEVTVQITRTIKGTSTSTITLTIAGGTSGGITMHAPAERIPAVGERVLIYAVPMGATRWKVLNGRLGVLRSLE